MCVVETSTTDRYYLPFYYTDNTEILFAIQSGVEVHLDIDNADHLITQADAYLTNFNGTYNSLAGKPTIPTTLDQIADGNTRKLSDYLPLAGGNMTANAYIKLNSSVAENDIHPSYINIRNKNTNAYSEYGSSNFLYSPDGNDEYTINFPQNNGTFALTSDIPSAITESTVSGWGFTKNAAPGTLNTNNSTAQTASASEALSGTINLHKIAKTGTYSDLIGTPTIPTIESLTTSEIDTI